MCAVSEPAATEGDRLIVVQSEPPHGESQAKNLHRALLLGVVAIASVFIFIVYLVGEPLLGPASEGRLNDYLFGAVAIAEAVYAAVLIRPRVGRREPGASLDDFWGLESNAGSANLTWFLLSGGTIMGAAGFLLAGGIACVTGIMAGVAGLIAYSPTRLAGE